jgi:predicted ATPase
VRACLRSESVANAFPCAGVPPLSTRDHSEAARFVTLIDELYEHGCRLICWADVPVLSLFDESPQVQLTNDAVSQPPPPCSMHRVTYRAPSTRLANGQVTNSLNVQL